MKKGPFRRHLDDRHDKKVFFLAFFIGLFVILLLRIIGSKYNGISGWDLGAIGFAVAILFLYGLYISVSKNRSGISVDRASDNIYYLGLLFTLVSLAYSLVVLSTRFSINETSRNSELVLSLLPDFGLALSSTIFGIFGRIVLQQIRNDPLDVETEAREELGILMRQLRETVGQLITNLNGLSTQTSVVLTEMNQTVSKTLEQSANENAQMVRGFADEVGTLNAQFNKGLGNMLTQLQGFEKIPQILGGKFEDLSVKLSTATEQIEQASGHQTQLAAELLSSVGALREAFSEAGLSRISGIVENAEIRFTEINSKLVESEDHLKQTLSGINNHVESLNLTSSTIDDYGEKIEASVKSVDEANNEYVEELSKAAKTLRTKTDQI